MGLLAVELSDILSMDVNGTSATIELSNFLCTRFIL